MPHSSSHQPEDGPDSHQPSGPEADLDDLEQKLASIRPTPPAEAFLKRVGRQLDAREKDRVERKIVWMRFAPVAAAACLVLAISFTMREYYRNQAALVTGGGDKEKENEPPTLTTPPPRTTEVQGGRFVPVSEGNFFRGAAEGGVVDVENGKPVREWRLEFEDAWHWHDPESETNLRIFRPREEIILVPVETD